MLYPRNTNIVFNNHSLLHELNQKTKLTLSAKSLDIAKYFAGQHRHTNLRDFIVKLVSVMVYPYNKTNDGEAEDCQPPDVEEMENDADFLLSAQHRREMQQIAEQDPLQFWVLIFSLMLCNSRTLPPGNVLRKIYYAAAIFCTDGSVVNFDRLVEFVVAYGVGNFRRVSNARGKLKNGSAITVDSWDGIWTGARMVAQAYICDSIEQVHDGFRNKKIWRYNAYRTALENSKVNDNTLGNILPLTIDGKSKKSSEEPSERYTNLYELFIKDDAINIMQQFLSPEEILGSCSFVVKPISNSHSREQGEDKSSQSPINNLMDAIEVTPSTAQEQAFTLKFKPESPLVVKVRHVHSVLPESIVVYNTKGHTKYRLDSGIWKNLKKKESEVISHHQSFEVNNSVGLSLGTQKAHDWSESRNKPVQTVSEEQLDTLLLDELTSVVPLKIIVTDDCDIQLTDSQSVTLKKNQVVGIFRSISDGSVQFKIDNVGYRLEGEHAVNFSVPVILQVDADSYKKSGDSFSVQSKAVYEVKSGKVEITLFSWMKNRSSSNSQESQKTHNMGYLTVKDKWTFTKGTLLVFSWRNALPRLMAGRHEEKLSSVTSLHSDSWLTIQGAHLARRTSDNASRQFRSRHQLNVDWSRNSLRSHILTAIKGVPASDADYATESFSDSIYFSNLLKSSVLTIRKLPLLAWLPEGKDDDEKNKLTWGQPYIVSKSKDGDQSKDKTISFDVSRDKLSKFENDRFAFILLNEGAGFEYVAGEFYKCDNCDNYVLKQSLTESEDSIQFCPISDCKTPLHGSTTTLYRFIEGVARADQDNEL